MSTGSPVHNSKPFCAANDARAMSSGGRCSAAMTRESAVDRPTAKANAVTAASVDNVAVMVMVNGVRRRRIVPILGIIRYVVPLATLFPV